MDNKNEILINKILDQLTGKLEDFYLAGGTALAHFYFRHRLSLDLDFFTSNFSFTKIKKIVAELETKLKKSVQLVEQINVPDRANMMVFMVHFTKKLAIKIDFVEDFLELLKPLNVVNGIPVLSLEDIYIRKIYTVAGAGVDTDITGRKVIKGGREEAKDFYDIYYLSTTSIPLANFAFLYCDGVIRENLVRWYRTYDRFAIKSGIIDLQTINKIDYTVMDRHFKKEIEKIIEREVEFL